MFCHSFDRITAVMLKHSCDLRHKLQNTPKEKKVQFGNPKSDVQDKVCVKSSV